MNLRDVEIRQRAQEEIKRVDIAVVVNVQPLLEVYDVLTQAVTPGEMQRDALIQSRQVAALIQIRQVDGRLCERSIWGSICVSVIAARGHRGQESAQRPLGGRAYSCSSTREFDSRNGRNGCNGRSGRDGREGRAYACPLSVRRS